MTFYINKKHVLIKNHYFKCPYDGHPLWVHRKTHKLCCPKGGRQFEVRDLIEKENRKMRK